MKNLRNFFTFLRFYVFTFFFYYKIRRRRRKFFCCVSPRAPDLLHRGPGPGGPGPPGQTGNPGGQKRYAVSLDWDRWVSGVSVPSNLDLPLKSSDFFGKISPAAPDFIVKKKRKNVKT